MSRFDRAINKGVKAGIDSALADFCAPGGGLERVVWEQMDEQLSRDKPLTEAGFIWALRLCFRKHGCSYAQAADLASSTLRQYLADEQIKVGDRNYGWTRSDADVIADEYEFRHWEARS